MSDPAGRGTSRRGGPRGGGRAPAVRAAGTAV